MCHFHKLVILPFTEVLEKDKLNLSGRSSPHLGYMAYKMYAGIEERKDKVICLKKEM